MDTQQNAGLGDFQHAGQVWCQPPIAVNGPDVPGEALGRAGPSGRDDGPRQAGAVEGGASADTPAGAVQAMAHGGEDRGGAASPQARPLVSVAAAGGSQGGRPRRWNAPRHHHLSHRLGLRVTVGHEPTGGSTWHPIAPRLCSPMRLHGAGQPLRTVETLLSDRRDTTTTTGLRVTASRIQGVDGTGTRVTDAVLTTLPVAHHAVGPPWHDTRRPRVHGALAM